ncbi:MAG: lipoyl(octanoyl) transferase LipB [Alphaproteobacteria bacterium]|nr:lipoyl(octanoyl) transferase LipB [Alphaproteobacteria bacterium]
MLEWKISKGLVPYPEALAAMEARVAEIQAGRAPELAWLLEHPPLYTAGTSAKTADLLSAQGFPVYQTGRGGQYTYHGPGQRVAYVMLDLKQRNAQDVRAYVESLERWIIATLGEFGVRGETREGRVGVWVKEEALDRKDSSPSTEYRVPSTESKIAALGIRIRKWVTYHGICINVNPDLSHYAGIIPCGIREHGVTSLAALGINATMAEVDAALKRHFPLTGIAPEKNNREDGEKTGQQRA